MPGLGKERNKENSNHGNKKDAHDEAADPVCFSIAVAVAAIRAKRPRDVELWLFDSYGCRNDCG